MQSLRKIESSPDASYYAIEGDYTSPVHRYIVSTAETREICNRPEVVGCEYTDRLRRAVTKALVNAPFRSVLEAHSEHRVCVLNFLRGGLNFDIRSALHEGLGFNHHTSAFMSSQRSKTPDGRWQVKEDMYRKLRIPSQAFVLAGDVVATGITVANGFEVLLKHLVTIGSSISRLVFFTIGCHKLEKHLATFDTEFRNVFPDYEGTYAVYFEGKFKLVDSKTELRIGIPGTDLIRRDCLLAPELVASQWEQVSYPLERCTIYDAGSRAFDTPRYVADVLEYWVRVQELAGEGFTLQEAVAERWPVDDYADYDVFRERSSRYWPDMDDGSRRGLYQSYVDRWPSLVGVDWSSSDALVSLCSQRIESLRSCLE